MPCILITFTTINSPSYYSYRCRFVGLINFTYNCRNQSINVSPHLIKRSAFFLVSLVFMSFIFLIFSFCGSPLQQMFSVCYALWYLSSFFLLFVTSALNSDSRALSFHLKLPISFVFSLVCLVCVVPKVRLIHLVHQFCLIAKLSLNSTQLQHQLRLRLALFPT